MTTRPRFALAAALLLACLGYGVYFLISTAPPAGTREVGWALFGAAAGLLTSFRSLLWGLPLIVLLLIADRDAEVGLYGFWLAMLCAAVALFVSGMVRAARRDQGDRDDDLPKPPALVALSGYAGAGKDTAALALLADGWTRASFADKLREVALAVDPLVPASSYAGTVPTDAAPVLRVERLSALVGRVGWTVAKRNEEVRSLLQRFGTDAGRRVLGENVWVDAVMGDLPDGPVVFTDCRFPNEAAAIRDAGGMVVRVVRPGVSAVNAHVSETALDGYDFDAVVVNGGDPEEVGRQLRAVVARLAV